MSSSSKYQFLKSALAAQGAGLSNEQVLSWLRDANDAVNVDIRQIDFADMKQWNYDEQRGNIAHQSGGFFSIDGIRVETNWGDLAGWDQPIINQPEIGYLGFITREIQGVLHFLVQAKIEPGNINSVQISPTLQATKSNFTQLHKGSQPLFLEQFRKATPRQTLLDQLQSEQGARFLRKRNRNIIVKLDEEIEVPDNFTWLTLGQIKELMRYDNVVNMDTRTVVSGIFFGEFGDSEIELIDFLSKSSGSEDSNSEFLRSSLSRKQPVNSTEDVISFLSDLKSNYEVSVRRKPLKELDTWVVGDGQIARPDGKFFRVVAVDVNIEGREVKQWDQPMVEPAQAGICAFVCKKIDGLMHFAVQAKLECGNHDTFELAPTVQCLTGDYRNTPSGALPFLDYVLRSDARSCYIDCLQSEEGGRFYREENRNMIVMAGDEVATELPPNYIWMTLNQLGQFLKYNNYVNIQARSLIAAISFA